ncbi:hypothetical protein GWK47_016472 [Chionoecetes opilio]|uniref:Uncharacterized protein n=1 Tax=Chionoecetes opilio TaxID=41210 RepID=A0A8J4XSF2_CHIOP|nr:hypothetical protein GWK47_016472 [Chionoecetes opilio]
MIHKVHPPRMSSQPTSALPLVLQLDNLPTTPCSDGPIVALLAEQTWNTSESLVEFLLPPMPLQHADGRRMAFLKGASAGRRTTPWRLYENFSVSPTLFLGRECPAKPLPGRSWSSRIQARWNGQAIYCLKLHCLNSPLIADWSRARRRGNAWALFRCYCVSLHALAGGTVY